MTQTTNSRLAWFNGKFLPENQVLIPFRDRSWKYGDGAFDMTRTFNGRAFRLKEHIDRFYRSLRYLRLDPGRVFAWLRPLVGAPGQPGAGLGDAAGRERAEASIRRRRPRCAAPATNSTWRSSST